MEKDTTYKNPYYEYYSSDAIYLAPNRYTIMINLPEYTFEDGAKTKLKYKITVEETEPDYGSI